MLYSTVESCGSPDLMQHTTGRFGARFGFAAKGGRKNSALIDDG